MADPFSSIAPYYDQLMSTIDYPGWIDYLGQLFRLAGATPHRILDLACGTGNVAVPLARQGYEVVGLDVSEAMLAECRRKADGLALELVRADMRSFKLDRPADACISLFDSLNYLLTDDDLKRAFASVHASLVPNGLFIFDMNTVFGLATVWGSRTSVRESGPVYSVWENTYDERRRVSTLRLTLFARENGAYRRFDETHRERAYSIADLEKFLKQKGFHHVRIFHHPTLTPAHEYTSRVMVLARTRA